ncbi:hypothetical protein [Treponema sp.]|uniref:hypothetical protein n=1 Tax=Treponema sp. TaxID=166 RepID=UPI00257D0918|nr:hypothetical protein [Treponema sp.]MBE6354740.1 hypothetical protein [Treponema sp.]
MGINPKYVNELTHNYRTSYNIQKLSNLYLEKSGKHTYTLNDENRIQGPKPQLFVSKEETEYSYDNTCKQIAYSVRMLLKSCKREMKDIYIVASNKEELDKIYSNLLLINDGIKIHFLKSSNNDNNKLFSENSIKLGTIESIKGIDCPILLFLITQNLINNSNSELVQDSIYAVINRAMHLLEVFMPNHSFESEPVCNLIDLYKK